MPKRWFYTCGGLVFGPVSTAEMREVVAKGILGAADLVWPEEGGRAAAVAPASAEDGAGPSAALSAPGQAPDWLGDVQAAAEAERQPPRPAATAVPDWIGDLRRIEEPAAPARPDAGAEPSAAEPTSPPAAGGIPDWLADVTEAQTRAPPRPAAEPAEEQAPAPAAPLPATTPEGIPLARRVSAPAAGAVPGRLASAAEPTQDTGATQTIQEVFESARVTLRRCVDADANRPLVVAGNLKAISELPAIQQLWKRVHKYGPQLSAGLRRHLEFLVDNRRKFYTVG